MAENRKIPLVVENSVLTEETDTGAANYYKDGNRIRFRQGMPESLGGWVLRSLGKLPGGPTLTGAQGLFADVAYAATDTQIDITSDPLTAPDGSPVWLFGDSEIGGWAIGAEFNEGSTTVTLGATQTAGAGSALLLAAVSEFYEADGADIVGPRAAGTDLLQISLPAVQYVAKDSVVVVVLADTSRHITQLRYAIEPGTSLLGLRDALPSEAQEVQSVHLFPVGTVFVNQLTMGEGVGAVVRFLAAPIVASLTATVTEPLHFTSYAQGSPSGENGYDIREFQQTFLDGDHAAAAQMDIDPASTNGISSVGSIGFGIPAGAILVLGTAETERRYLGTVRAVHDWTDLDGQQWCAIGTEKKLYLINDDGLFDITPLDATGTLTNPFTTNPNMPGGGNDTQYVRVADVDHGRSPGDTVRFSGASPVSGIDMNGEWEVAIVTSANNYYIFVGDGYVAPPVGAGGGTVDYEYDLKSGPSISEVVTGYGVGPYGAGPYGISSPPVPGQTGILRPLRIWSLDNFGQDLIAAPSGGPMYHWRRVSGPGVRAVLVPTSPPAIQRLYVSQQARHIVAFGTAGGNTSSPQQQDKLLIRFSDQENLVDWEPTVINRAGDDRIGNGSEIIAAIRSRDDFIIFTDLSLHAMQYIGGQLVFGIRSLGESVAIIGPNAAVDVNGVVYFMATDDFMVWDGTIRSLPCSVRNRVFDDINRTQGFQVFASVNRTFNEVWWFYPSAGSLANDRYVKYNYVEQSWDFGDLARSAFHDRSNFYGTPYGFNNGLVWQHEVGIDDCDEEGDPLPMNSFIETYDMEMGEGDLLLLVTQMVPDFKVLQGRVDLTVSGRPYPQDPRVFKGPYPIIPGQSRQDLRFKSRQIAYRISATRVGDRWRMGVWRAEARPHGRRGGR